MEPSSLEAWHRSHSARVEACLAPNLPIIDAHHHFFPPGPPKVRPPQFANTFGRVETTGTGFMPADFKRDAKGVNVVTTVHVEAGRFYLEQPKVPQYLRPVGETAQIASISRESSGRLCRGIVAKLDLTITSSDEVIAALSAHCAQINEHCVLSGVRFSIAHDELDEIVSAAPKGVVYLPRVVENARLVGRMGLSIDIWLYHTQFDDLCYLASQAPDTIFICDHVAMPIRVGSRAAATSDQVFSEWKSGMAKLSKCENVMVKFGGLCMFIGGFCKEEPLSSTELAQSVQPWFDEVIRLFPARVLFESNWPMDKGGVSYVNWWNACVRLCKDQPLSVRNDLFYACANRTYDLGMPERSNDDFRVEFA